MENKINIAELLKDCPKGMELYSPIFGKVYLDKIRPHVAIVVTIDKYKEEFLYDGRYGMNGECMLFPSKDQRDWSKFQRPFKDGDIVSTRNGIWIGIIKKPVGGAYETYVTINGESLIHGSSIFCFERFATDDEKAKFFKIIKDNGYKWNSETKTLEKLPKFKVGDRINKKDSNEDIVLITDITDDYYIVETKYGMKVAISISIQNNYKLIPNKFDITTLKPFESRVLMRSSNAREWTGTTFSHYSNGKFYGCGMCCDQCIPYEGNERLLGTTNDCDDYYKL